MGRLLNIKERSVTAGVCSIVLLSVLSSVSKEKSTCAVSVQKLIEYLHGGCLHANEAFGAAGVLGISFLVGNSVLKSLCVLYLLLSPAWVGMLVHGESLGILLALLVHSTSCLWGGALVLPSISGPSYGSVLVLSVKRKSMLPFLAAFVLASISHTVYEPQEKRTPLLSSSVLFLTNKNVWISSPMQVVSKDTRAHETWRRRAVGSVQPSGWKVVVDGLIENPSPEVPITSGLVVHLQSAETGKYLYTSDIASLLTLTHQEVSCVPSPSEHTKFMIVAEGGSPSVGKQIYSTDRFFIKHKETGVFLRVLKRKDASLEGYEIHGEKQTGGDLMKGSVSSLWTSSARAGPRYSTVTLKDAVLYVKRSLVRYTRELLFHPKNRKEAPPCSFVFLLLFIASLFKAVHDCGAREELYALLLDCAIFSLLGFGFSHGMCSMWISGIRHGLDLNIKELVYKMQSVTQKNKLQ
ncbi:hypothetical protein NECID01_0293 [Nematocida sp. AWRm77]|nr:hypothetical protein NECID01_0293 [Nematocida sp. AWRm77]